MFFRRAVRLFPVTAAMSFAAIPAIAQTFAPTSAAKGYNVFIKGNITFQGGEVDAGVFTGADLILDGATTVGSQTSGYYPYAARATNNVSLAVTGKVVYTSGNQTYLNNGYLRIGNLLLPTDPNRTTLFERDTNNNPTNLRAAKAGVYNSYPNIQVQRRQTAYDATNVDRAAQTPGIDATAAFNDFATAAAMMSRYTSSNSCASINLLPVPTGSNPHVTLVSGKTNVLNLTLSQLSDLNLCGTVIFDQTPSATMPLVINVTSSSGAYTIPHFTMPNVGGLNGNSGNFILWNFYQATSIGIDAGNEIYGTIFAPNATVSRFGGNNINGQIIANVFNTGTSGEMHDHVFSPNLPNCGNPLPVTLIGFTGKNVGGSAKLTWKTASELNFSHFEVEASDDGRTFSQVGQNVDAKGTGAAYEFMDPRPLGATLNYYRLKTVDRDATFTYSPVVVIRKDTSAQPTLYPTLVGGNEPFYIKFGSIGQARISVIDMLGQEILTKSVSNESEITLQAPVQSGQYVVLIQNESGVKKAKLIVR